jgi:hypothetical protein
MSAIISISTYAKGLRAEEWITMCNSGKLAIYDGTKPTSPDDAITTQNKLVEWTLPNPSGYIDGTSFIGYPISPETVTQSGTGNWARLTNSGGTTLSDWTVGLSDAAIILSNLTLTIGALVTPTDWRINE